MEDRLLAREMRAAGNVLVTQKIAPLTPGAVRAPLEDDLEAISADIAEAALGVGPTPIAKSAFGRYDSFWTFKEAGSPAPTLPALALHTYLQSSSSRVDQGASPRTSRGCSRTHG